MNSTGCAYPLPGAPELVESRMLSLTFCRNAGGRRGAWGYILLMERPATPLTVVGKLPPGRPPLWTHSSIGGLHVRAVTGSPPMFAQ